MRHSGFFATGLMVLAFLGFAGTETARASYPASSEFSLNPSAGTPILPESIKLAATGDKVAPPKKTQSKAPAAEKQKQPVKEEEGFFSKTFNSLIGNDKDKSADKDSKNKNTAGKKDGQKEEEGFLAKTLKSLVGNDDDKDKTKTRKKPLNPMEVAPTVSATKKVEKYEPTTAKSETKDTLKKTFENLVDLGGGKDQGDAQSVEKDDGGLLSKILGGGDKKDKPAAGKTVKGTPKRKIKAAKKDEGGLFDSILGGGDKKKDSTAEKQAKVKAKVSQPAPTKSRQITAKQKLGSEAENLEKDRGGTEKGKNILKESFKSLLKKEAEKEK